MFFTTYRNKSKKKIWSLGLCLCVLLTVCTACSHDEKADLPGSEAVLSELRQTADLATTELTVRKLAIYDSSKSERFSWLRPSTWKYGDQKCIVPVEVTLKYGYDLRDLTVRDIHTSADSSLVVVRLPRPKIIDAGYNTYIDEGSVVKMSTGLRSEVGHELIEEVRRKAYESVLAEDLTDLVGDDIERNTQTLLVSLLHTLGYENVVVEIDH